MSLRQFTCVVLPAGALLVPGCVSTDARHDHSRAVSMIRERTGVTDLYEPYDEFAVDTRVVELLADGVTLAEAEQIALLNNPGFQAQLAEIGASRADLAQSALMTNPTLSLGLQFPEGGGRTDLSVGLAAQIAELWQIPIRKAMAEAELERTLHQVGQRAVELIAEVRTLCYRVLALEQAALYTNENRTLAERAVALAEAQFHAGEVSEFDVNLARAGALDVQEELIRTRGLLQRARADLLHALGLSSRAAEVRLADTLPSGTPGLPVLEELLDLALEERFDVRVAWFDVQRSEAALRLEHRRFFPDVQLGFAFERGEQRALPGRKILADTARASIAAGKLTAPSIQSRGERNFEKSQIIDAKLGPTLALALPIFDQNQAQIAKEKVRVLQARKSYAARVESVAADIQRAAASAHAASEMLEFQRTIGIAQAQATVDGAERRYQAGEEGVLALIEAQDGLIKRRRTYVDALRDYAVALAELESAVGGRGVLAQTSTSMPASTQGTDE